jgi:sugar transferase (PEP-CTERM/EpsH1 system associated)
MLHTAAPLIVHVVYRFGVGGLENGVVNLINRLPVDRWRHAIISLTDVSAEFARRIQRTDVDVIALQRGPGHLVRDYPRLYRLFGRLAPAIVHTRNLAALEAVVPAWASRVPVRIHGEHGWDMQDPGGKRTRYRMVRRLYQPFVTRYVALSQHLESYLERAVGIGSDKIEQIYNGVDTERFVRARGARVAIPGCPFDPARHWLVGTVGRMERVKDPINLAQAFIHALALQPAATERMRLVMVGDGALRKEVGQVVEAAGVGDRVWFAGERSDVADVMRGLDCFALPSLAEGVSNTILEAMATGLPIVATRAGGNAELIEPGVTGTLVPIADSEALAQAVLGYYNDESLARRDGNAARYAAERRYSLARMVQDYETMYERALAQAGVALPPEINTPQPRMVESHEN